MSHLPHPIAPRLRPHPSFLIPSPLESCAGGGAEAGTRAEAGEHDPRLYDYDYDYDYYYYYYYDYDYDYYYYYYYHHSSSLFIRNERAK